MEWLTIAQVAQLLGCSVPDAKHWLSQRAGRIRFKTYSLKEPHYSGEDVRGFIVGNLFKEGVR